MQYKTNCLFAPIDVTRENNRPLSGKKRFMEMTQLSVMDKEFFKLRKSKIQKIYNQVSDQIPLSKITRNLKLEEKTMLAGLKFF